MGCGGLWKTAHAGSWTDRLFGTGRILGAYAEGSACAAFGLLGVCLSARLALACGRAYVRSAGARPEAAESVFLDKPLPGGPEPAVPVLAWAWSAAAATAWCAWRFTAVTWECTFGQGPNTIGALAGVIAVPLAAMSAIAALLIAVPGYLALPRLLARAPYDARTGRGMLRFDADDIEYFRKEDSERDDLDY